MNSSLRRIIGRFCITKQKDIFYTFDSSQITLCAVLKNFDKIKEQHIQDLGIRRVIYSINSEEETTNFLSERYDQMIQTLFAQPWLFKGVQFNLPVNLEEQQLAKKVPFKALLQVSQHLQSFKTKQYKEDIQIYLGLRNIERKDKANQTNDEAAKTKDKEAIKNNLDGIENIIENSFSFKLNYNIHHCTQSSIDFQYDVAQKHPTYLKSLDLDIYQYADPAKSEHEQNKHILSTAYQNNAIDYNTIFMRNLKVDQQKWKHSKNLQEGVISYQHLFDMMKMLHFKGSLGIQYDDEYFESNVKFVQELLLNHRYQQKERLQVTDLDEMKDLSGSTETLIDV